MAKAATSLKTASVLAFERKLANSDALMFAGNWRQGNGAPIVIQEKSVRGTISIRPNSTRKSRSLICKPWMWLRCRLTPIP